MPPTSEDINRVLAFLSQGPVRIEKAIQGLQISRMSLRTEEEPWSVSDILIHLRACSDVWGSGINAMLTQDNPTWRYVSPRASMKKPRYTTQTFETALDSFTQERQNLVKVLIDLDEVGWARPGTLTGTTPRHRNQTVFSYAERIINHEQPHLEQIEALLR